MSHVNEYVAFATGTGANTLTHAELLAANGGALVLQGFQPGVAVSEQVNTVWRMVTVAVAALAQFAADYGNADVRDDGIPANFEAALKSALDNLYGPKTGDIKATTDANMDHHPGWLKLNGQLVSRTTYAALFALYGTTYGAGDGSTTFALPDARGYFLRGTDDGRGLDAGRALGTFQDDALQNVIGHFPSTGNTGFTLDGPFSAPVTSPATIAGGSSPGFAHTDILMDLSSVVGVRTAAETRAKNLSVMYLVHA